MADTEQKILMSKVGSAISDTGLKGLMNKLGSVVNQVLTESQEVGSALQKIKDSGYDIFLIVEATAVGSSAKKNNLDNVNSTVPRKVNFRLTLEDAKFLKQLKISVDDYILE